jgi:uncharacterized protein YdeI (YjbR/CyaY-like superfamily)
MADVLPELLLPDATEWRAWLEENFASSPGVRLVLHRKGGAVTRLTYAGALDEALCYGWIDGQGSRRDEGSYLVRFTPRRSRSAWSAINVGHIARLEAEGRMRPAGQAAVAAAQADGRWEAAYRGQGTAEVPEDLAQAIAADPAAQAMFDVLTATNRYSLIYRVNLAKAKETRQRKIEGFVRMLASGETPYPQKRRPG